MATSSPSPLLKFCLSQQEVSLLAVAALDQLVVELVKASGARMSPAFFDWVADEATRLVDGHASSLFTNPRFMASLQVGDPAIAMERWVKHWMCPVIARKFEQLSLHIEEVSDSGPAPLGPDLPATRSVFAWQPPKQRPDLRQLHVG